MAVRLKHWLNISITSKIQQLAAISIIAGNRAWKITWKMWTIFIDAHGIGSNFEVNDERTIKARCTAHTLKKNKAIRSRRKILILNFMEWRRELCWYEYHSFDYQHHEEKTQFTRDVRVPFELHKNKGLSVESSNTASNYNVIVNLFVMHHFSAPSRIHRTRFWEKIIKIRFVTVSNQLPLGAIFSWVFESGARFA